MFEVTHKMIMFEVTPKVIMFAHTPIFAKILFLLQTHTKFLRCCLSTKCGPELSHKHNVTVVLTSERIFFFYHFSIKKKLCTFHISINTFQSRKTRTLGTNFSNVSSLLKVLCNMSVALTFEIFVFCSELTFENGIKYMLQHDCSADF